MKKWLFVHKWTAIVFGGLGITVIILIGAIVVSGMIKESRVHYGQPVGAIKTDDQSGQDLAIVTYVEKRAKTMV